MKRATCRGMEQKEVDGRTRIAVVFTCPECNQIFVIFGWADEPPPPDTKVCPHCNVEVQVSN